MLEDEKPDAIQLYNMAPDEQLEEQEPNGCTFVLFIGVEVEVFEGLCLAPGFGLIDTGAQIGIVGLRAYGQIEEILVVCELRMR